VKVAVAYHSYHHGNTKKVLEAIIKLIDVKLIDVSKCKEASLSQYDLIGFASGTYFGKFSDLVVKFAKNNLPDKKPVFLVNTYGLIGASTKEIEKIIADKGCELLGIYGCRGFDTFGPFKLVGGISKGHPDENDLRGAVEFFRKIIENQK